MSMTPNPNRKLGYSLAPSPAPFLTPRHDKRFAGWTDGSSFVNRFEKDRETNVQVVLRCRPLVEEEQRLNLQMAVSCNEQKKEVTVSQYKQSDKSYAFDKVFGPKSQQRSIYEHAISPIVNDVLEGFNCTVFAYGQTGTGKTYTMEGGANAKSGDLSVESGIIPRAVRHIFDRLEATKADYSMKVTFLELYNEEIIDLFVSDDNAKLTDGKMKRVISLMEDGKGGAVIRGLEEEVVYSAIEVYNLLERGSAKRRTADTMLNKHSSRSHSIFSITINLKEAAVGNEELIKCGRLNLVDLAGSENISRSGARESRAREAGEVNKSLLTLGRVITALVEHSNHIPYRDSKLTRLLRESLGGKAKTCIIATISPSIHCLEETLSSLDIVYRAKNIKNKPEANQRLSKSMLLKDLYLEMEKIKQDVRAAREKNGVYIPHERFAQDEAEKRAMNEKIYQLEQDLDLKTKEANKYKELYHAEQEHNLDVECELKECKLSLEDSKRAIFDLQDIQSKTNLTLKEKEFIISNLLHSEHSIIERAQQLHNNLENASEDMSLLMNKIDCQAKIEKRNRGLIKNFGSHLDQNLKLLHETVIGSVYDQHKKLRSLEEHVCSFLTNKFEVTKCLESRIEKIKDIYTSGVLGMKELAISLKEKTVTDLEQTNCRIFSQMMAVENFLATAVSEAEEVLYNLQNSLLEQKELLAFSAQKQEEGLQRSLVATQAISKITFDFFDDLHSRSSRLVTVLVENQIRRSRQLYDFENKFKEASAKVERVAIEKIAGILTDLTTTKSNVVTEAMRNMNDWSLGEKKSLEEEMSNIHLIADLAKNEWNSYVEKVELQFHKDVSSASTATATLGNIIHHCSDRVGESMQHLENAKLSVTQLHKDYTQETESSIEAKIQENILVEELLLSMSVQTNTTFQSATCDMLKTANDALLVDHEAIREIGALSKILSDQLETLQENHTESIKDIRSSAERCLLNEYMVDHPTTKMPKKIDVPNLASIEALRTPLFDELVTDMGSEDRQRQDEIGGKQLLSVYSNIQRNPLTPINQ